MDSGLLRTGLPKPRQRALVRVEQVMILSSGITTKPLLLNSNGTSLGFAAEPILTKVEVAGSKPVSRSRTSVRLVELWIAFAPSAGLLLRLKRCSCLYGGTIRLRIT